MQIINGSSTHEARQPDACYQGKENISPVKIAMQKPLLGLNQQTCSNVSLTSRKVNTITSSRDFAHTSNEHPIQKSDILSMLDAFPMYVSQEQKRMTREAFDRTFDLLKVQTYTCTKNDKDHQLDLILKLKKEISQNIPIIGTVKVKSILEVTICEELQFNAASDLVISFRCGDILVGKEKQSLDALLIKMNEEDKVVIEMMLNKETENANSYEGSASLALKLLGIFKKAASAVDFFKR